MMRFLSVSLATVFIGILIAISSADALTFSAEESFPSWDGKIRPNDTKIEEGRLVQGIVGVNNSFDENCEENGTCEDLTSGETKTLLYFLPRIVNIITLFIAPVVMVLFIYAGLCLMWGEEEDLTAAKNFFKYGIMGVIFIVSSYSMVKIIYFVFDSAA